MASRILPARRLIPKALECLSARARDAQVWTIYLPDRSVGYDVFLTWLKRADGADGRERFGSVRLNPAAGREYEEKVPKTGGGEHLYEMHFSLHYLSYEWAIRIVGLCGMVMLVGIVSGVVVHKKIITDFLRSGTA